MTFKIGDIVNQKYVMDENGDMSLSSDRILPPL